MKSKPKKLRKRMPRVDWKARYKAAFVLVEDANRQEKDAYEGWWKAAKELSRYRLICDWTCQRIEKLEANDSEQFRVEHASSVLWNEIAEGWQRKCGALEQEKRILLETLFVVQAENIMQAEDILRQRDELIKLRGKPEERISCNR